MSSVIKNLARNKYSNLSATADSIIGGPGVIRGIFVNSTSSGTLKLEDSATHGSGNVILNTFTPPAVGFYEIDAFAAVDLSITIGGTINYTVMYAPANKV